MKNNNLIITGVAALVAVVAISGLAFSTFAAGSDTATTPEVSKTNDRSAMMRERGQNHRALSDEEIAEHKAERETRQAEAEARRTKVDAAVEAGDYNAWVAAVGDNNPFVGKITADNFSKLQDIHSIRGEIEEKHEEIKTIMDDLGIENPGRGMRGEACGEHNGRQGGGGMGF